VQVNGSVARTDLLLQEGDVVRVVMKVGSGAVWGSTAGEWTCSTLHSSAQHNHAGSVFTANTTQVLQLAWLCT
jgi:hypothetical protein